MKLLRNPDHVTVAVADAATAIEFFELLGFRKQHVAVIDGGAPARYMGMPDMMARHITLELEETESHFEIQLLEFDPSPADDPVTRSHEAKRQLPCVDMGDQPVRLRRLVEQMSQDCDAWRKFGVRLMVAAAALAISVWATVRGHPEQDLPLWPALIFAALSCIGLGLTVATALHLPPFRAPTPQRNT